MKIIMLVGLIIMTAYAPKNLAKILSTTGQQKRKLHNELKNFKELDNEYLTLTSIITAVVGAIWYIIFFGVSLTMVGSLWFAVVSVCLVLRRLLEYFFLVEWSTDPYNPIPLLKIRIGMVSWIFTVMKLGYIAYLWMFFISIW